jgi:hypothetical protein
MHMSHREYDEDRDHERYDDPGDLDDEVVGGSATEEGSVEVVGDADDLLADFEQRKAA